MTEYYGPDGPRSRQVLVYLHGHGSSPAMVHPYFRQHHDDGRVRLCPQASLPTDGGWSWFGSGPRGADTADVAASVAAVRALVDATVSEAGLGWGDVILGGFSQGAATALAVASALAADGGERLGALLVQAGFVPEIVGPGEIDLGRIDCARVLVQHGESDDVVPVEIARDLAVLIGADRTDRGVVDLAVTPGGHTLSAAMLDGVRGWLDDDLVGPTP